MKICILGNSHVACLKSAWDEDSGKYPDTALTFFASPLAGLSELQLSGDRLEAATPQLRKDLEFTSDGADAVAVREFDAFLIMGLGFTTPKVDRRLSAAVRHATLQDGYAQSLNAKLARMVRQVSSVPLFVGSNPFAARDRAGRDLSALLPPEQITRLLSQQFAGEKLVFLPQPPETTEAHGWLTKVTYTSGAPRLAHVPQKVGVEFDDNLNRGHMNADYGRTYLAKFFEALKQAR